MWAACLPLPLAATCARHFDRGSLIEPSLHQQPAGQIAILGQVVEHALTAIRRVCQHVKTPEFSRLTEDSQQLHAQLRTCAVNAAMPLGFVTWQVQAEQQRQAKRTSRPQRKTHDHPQYDPTVPQHGSRLASRRDRGVDVHAHAVNLTTTLVGQCVVQRQENRVLLQPRFQQPKDSQPKFIERPYVYAPVLVFNDPSGCASSRTTPRIGGQDPCQRPRCLAPRKAANRGPKQT